MKEVIEQLEKVLSMLKEKEQNQTETVPADKVALTTLAPGETFHMGEHEFLVLGQSMDGKETKVISKGLIGGTRVFDDDTRDYGNSSLAKYIESEIQPMIEAAVGAENLVEHEVELISVDMQEEFDNYLCKVRPVTFDEAREYNPLLVNEELDSWWWTCTPWSTEERGWKYSIAVVSPSGGINISRYFSGYGVRPFCILKSNIFVSQ